MQRWGGILFIYLSFRIQSTALSELQDTSSVSNRFWDWNWLFFRTICLLRTICWLVHWLYYSSSISVKFLDFAEKCVLQHLLVIDWCAYLLFAVQRAWAWDYVDFLNRQINPEARWSEVWSVNRSGESPFSVCVQHMLGLSSWLRSCTEKIFSCNALMFGIYEIFGFWLVLLI